MADRFWPKVLCDLQTKCWVWQGSTNKAGYGRFGSGPRSQAMQAHRASWLIHYGWLPFLDVLHHCDNPPCVRPDHLFLGTDYTNSHDMFAKGRNRGQFPRGSAHPYPGGKVRG